MDCYLINMTVRKKMRQKDSFLVSTRRVVSDDECAIRLARVYDLILRLKDDRPVGRLVGSDRDTGQGTRVS